MPIRIYALAKELDIDSKELVEICNRAGVTGKGSALASLTDEELEKVKSYISGGGKKQDRKPKAASDSKEPAIEQPIREERPVQTGRPKEIRTIRSGNAPLAVHGRTARPADAGVEELPEEELSVEMPAAEAPAVESTEAPAASQPTMVEPAEFEAPEATPAGAEDSSEINAIRRDDYIAPGGGARGKVRVLGGGRGPEPGEAGGKREANKPKQVAPTTRVKFAKMPTPAAPPTPQAKKGGEPAPQKPIMQLPKAAIQGAKAGQKAPLEEFTKQHEKKRKDKERRPVDISPVDTEEGGDSGDRRRTTKSKGLAAMAGGREARAAGRRTKKPSDMDSDSGDRMRRRSRAKMQRKGVNTAAPRKSNVELELPCTIRDFSEATGIATIKILRTLMTLGTMANINTVIETETAEYLAAEHGVEINLKEALSIEDEVITKIEETEDDPDSLVERPPVVTFLGHVDHGKTSLMDKIIGQNVVSGEAGGITQHIRAYIIDKGEKKIAFVDTPGHEAFTAMRARGANVTDIAVLIIAADDGIMPQTEEAISHAKAAEVPIIVALNKIDLPGANPDKVMQQLSTHGLLPTEWGGDVEVVKTSAITGEGIDALLETILLTAELHEYSANPNRPAVGVCLESEQESDRGVLAKIIVKNGTLRVGDVIVCGDTFGRVKAMYDTLNPRKRLTEAPTSTPVNITGLDQAPGAGDKFYVLDDIAQAREIAGLRADRNRSESLGVHTVKISFDEFQKRLESGTLGGNDAVTTLNIIVRADTRGSIEALQKEMQKLDHPEVKVRVLQAAVGAVSVADVTLAEASDAVIIAFNVIPDEAARSMADDKGIEIRRYNIIYKATEEIKSLLEGRLKPEERINELGRALVQRVFVVSRLGSIAGCRVLGGTIERGCRIRVNRDGRTIGDYPLESLKREKDDAKEVREGYECGMKLQGFNDIKEGDILEAYKVEEIARTLD
ncbi:translation initiation factor IF-2 [Blastopirellula sp. JC732]|uniref:Translation initiation factor IF-2 n=1 Tax=Blastopirellula sediminis TaxID=2894196 RepID=A0A9X1MQN0_9BACT|nr:translation initiation factor IF-2 [Blastopirellula sediminis]MCC9605002.1 translation initiation factor IF-2 [Blastopirellula sediminis]MCC9631698.1 translation initiation factor IF-2 [Blastopirellula sediminis]